MVAETISSGKSSPSHRSGKAPIPRRILEIDGDVEERIPLRIEEFSRVLGGGIVPGSVVLIGGEPGIGKSTLLLQMVLALAQGNNVLYVSGEESENQLKARALRLMPEEEIPENLYLLTETDLDLILLSVEQLRPVLVVVDSIQTTQVPEIDSGAGSISQVRESASRLQSLAKSSGVTVFLVGHVTKEGSIAGPKVLEHIVDTVLYMEGDAFHAFRLLRSVKNRFGATSEVGVFEMRSSGLVEVPNPSEAFLAERVLNSPGSAIAVTMEGTRPLLVEIQGLTSTTAFGNPRRTANGVDFNRLLLTVAVLTRRAGLRLSDQDVFVNVVGGLQVSEPAADLAIAVAIASSVRDKAVDPGMAFIGEVGLSGEVRTVAQLPARLHEVARLGFARVVVPKGLGKEVEIPSSLEILPVQDLRSTLGQAFA
jgi:DNA repair protein RadA/Sms